MAPEDFTSSSAQMGLLGLPPPCTIEFTNTKQTFSDYFINYWIKPSLCNNYVMFIKALGRQDSKNHAFQDAVIPLFILDARCTSESPPREIAQAANLVESHTKRALWNYMASLGLTGPHWAVECNKKRCIKLPPWAAAALPTAGGRSKKTQAPPIFAVRWFSAVSTPSWEPPKSARHLEIS